MSKLNAVLYTDGGIECDRIRMLLRSLDGEYLEYLLGADFSDRQFRAEFGSEAEYPQITINGKHIGSLKETLQYFNQQGLL
jgi:glutaredoxin